MKFRLETMKFKKHTTQDLIKIIERFIFISNVQQLNFQHTEGTCYDK